MPPSPAVLLTQQQAAELLGVTPRTMRDWASATPPVPRREDGKYDGAELVAWYVEREVNRFDDAEAALTAARARKEEALAGLREIELAQKEGELIPLDMHEARLATLCDRLRAKLLNLPGRAAPHLVGRRSVQEALMVLEPAVAEAMQALVDMADDIEADAAADEQADAA